MMALPQLTKALIINTQTGERIPVMYNPEQYSLEQGNNFSEVGIPGLNAPPIQYVRGKGRVLAMDLFFDTYEAGSDVRQYTSRIVGLLDQVAPLHAPPILLFTMGQFNFECVLVDAGQRFTMFLRDGTPVRSTLQVRFHEFVRVDVQIAVGLFGGPPLLESVVTGRTLSQIATDALGDPARWREIADQNDVEDPFNLPAGTPLVVRGKTPA